MDTRTKEIIDNAKREAHQIVEERKLEGQGLMCSASRDSAKELLARKYEEALARANHLHTIMQMLPTSLTSQQDDALWSILTNL